MIDNHKKDVQKKIEFLLNLLKEVYNINEFLFPPDYIEVLEIYNNFVKKGELSQDKLKKMNYIYRKVISQKENLEKFGSLMTYEKWVKWKILDILYPDSGVDVTKTLNLKEASIFMMQYFLKENGDTYTLSEAREMIKTIIEKKDKENNEINNSS